MEETKKCKHCQSDIPKKARICPNCRKKQKPGGCLILIIAFVVIIIISAIIGTGSDKSKNAVVSSTETKESDSTQVSTDIEDTAKEEAVAENKESDTASESTDLTIGQRNALSKANSYLSLTAFSYSGLITQLEFEKFSTEDSTYAADNCGADWNEQAEKKAQSYLDLTAFSRDSLITQLEFDGFTTEQAEYGVSAVGY